MKIISSAALCHLSFTEVQRSNVKELNLIIYWDVSEEVRSEVEGPGGDRAPFLNHPLQPLTSVVLVLNKKCILDLGSLIN